MVASRYCERGERNGFGWARAMASRSSTTAARLLFPQRLRDVTDPMSGFFLMRRDAIAVDELRPRGFKILLEILSAIRGCGSPRSGSPSASATPGRSKATIREGLRYLSLLARLRLRPLRRSSGPPASWSTRSCWLC